MKELFFEELFVTDKVKQEGAVGGAVRITNKKLKAVLWKSYNRFKSQLDWDEYLGSAMVLTWNQIQRFDGDWEAILAGDEREQNKLFKAISKAVYHGTIQVANPNSKFMSGNIVDIDFVSLDERNMTASGFTVELIESTELTSFFSVKEGYAPTPFVSWLKESAPALLGESQLEFYEKYLTCLDNSKEEVESKTGLPHKQISKRVQAIKKKVEKAWEEEKGFKHTFLYQELIEERDYMESLLDQDFDHLDFTREIAGDMEAGNKLGNLVLDNLSHSELIEVNTWRTNKQTVYKIVQLMIARINQIESFIQQEEAIYATNKLKQEAQQESACTKDFTYRTNLNSDCKVFDSAGNLLKVIPAGPAVKQKVKKLNAFGDLN